MSLFSVRTTPINWQTETVFVVWDKMTVTMLLKQVHIHSST